MAIVSINKNFREQASADSISEQYTVTTDSMAYTANQIRFAAGVPHDGIVGNWSIKTTADRDPENPLIWYVDVKYSPKDDKSTPDEARILDVSCTPSPYERPVYVDKDDAPIVNSAGDPFQQQPTIVQYDEKWSIKFTTPNGSIVSAFRDTIGKRNQDTFGFTYKGQNFTFAAETSRLIGGSFTFKHNYNGDGQDVEYWEIQLEILYRPDGGLMWDVEVADLGFYDKDGNPFRDKEGKEKTTPTQLDGAGMELEDNGTAVPLQFDVADSVSFAGLFTGL
jgi:hypothetical protein